MSHPYVASRAGTQVTYGARVKQCQTKFGVRYAVSRGTLYDEDNGNEPVPTGYLGRQEGPPPYGHQRTVSSTIPADTYRTRVDISIVLKTRRDPSTRRVERWTHSGKHCRGDEHQARRRHAGAARSATTCRALYRVA